MVQKDETNLRTNSYLAVETVGRRGLML